MILSLLLAVLVSSSGMALEPFQGEDYKVASWRCGAPLVEALRESDPENLLGDPKKELMLKASLERISESNLKDFRSRLGKLNAEEEGIISLIQTRYPAPIVHRTSLAASLAILKNDSGLISSTKRKLPGITTPPLEQGLFAGFDCLFTSVSLSYGIQQYGTTIIRVKNDQSFAWGTILTGYTWNTEINKRSRDDERVDNLMKREFARMVFTNNHWDEALGLQIIEHVRKGTSIRGLGVAYEKKTMLKNLLSQSSRGDFWKLITKHRLAFLEGHFSDSLHVKDFEFVQFRNLESTIVEKAGFPAHWFAGIDPFIQFFNRDQ
jgi:hypothetical protein